MIVKQLQNQETNVGGNLNINSKSAKFDAANINTTEISGKIDTMSLISRQDAVEQKQNEWTVGLSVTTVAGNPIPYPSKFEHSDMKGKESFIRKASSLNVINGIKETDFKVKELALTGATVKSHEDIKNFAEDIQSKDLYNECKMESKGYSAMLNVKARGGKLGYEMQTSTTKTINKASVVSIKGKVSTKYHGKTNTDYNQQTRKLSETKRVAGATAGLSRKGGEFQLQSNSFDIGVKATTKGVGGKIRVNDTKIAIDCKKGIEAEIKTNDTEIGIKARKDGAGLNVKKGKQQIAFGVEKKRINANIKIDDNEVGFGASVGPWVLSYSKLKIVTHSRTVINQYAKYCTNSC